MITFKDYLEEKYLASGKAPLYHFTDKQGLMDIAKSGKLSSKDYGNPEYDPTKSVPTKKDSDSRVSLTRDKNLDFAKRDVRITLDADSLRARHKLHPYADRSMMNGRRTVNTDGESRQEAEEVSKKAIHLHKVKHKIEVSQALHDDIHKSIAHSTKELQRLHSLHKEMTSPGFKWNPDKHAAHFGLDVEKNRAVTKDNPDWLPKNAHQRVANSINTHKGLIADHENLLKHIHGTF